MPRLDEETFETIDKWMDEAMFGIDGAEYVALPHDIVVYMLELCNAAGELSDSLDPPLPTNWLEEKHYLDTWLNKLKSSVEMWDKSSVRFGRG